MKHFRTASAVLLAAAMLLSSCGNGKQTAPEPEKTSVTTTTAASVQQEESNTGETVDAAALIPDDLEITPALWKATDPATGNYIYLMGTFHAVPDNAYPLPDYIEQVYDGCDSIAVEYDIERLTDPAQLDMAAMQEYSAALVYSDGSALPDHISESTYESVKQFADTALGGWNTLYDMYNIGFWVSTISSYQISKISGFDFEKGIDRYFISKAKSDGKKVIDIEPLSAQTGVINAYTDALGDYVIAENIKAMDDTNEVAKALAELYITWATGDVYKHAALSDEAAEEEDLPPELKADYEKYQDIVLGSRNRNMAERAAEFIKNGDNVFFMVGLGHFSEDEGIPALLTSMGFTVEKVN